MKRSCQILAVSVSSLLVEGALISSCPAQQPVMPPLTPATNPADASADGLMDRMIHPASQAPAPLQPISFPPTLTKATAGALGAVVTTQPTIREGTFMKDRTGVLSKSPDGLHAIFTLDPDGSPIPEPPMVILPNLKLQMMEQAISSSDKPTHFRITAMLTEYRNNNYLYITQVGGGSSSDAVIAPIRLSAAPSVLPAQPAMQSPAPQSTTPQSPAPQSPAPEGTTSPSGDSNDILDRMLKPANPDAKPLTMITAPVPMNQDPTPAVAPNVLARPVMREGTPMVDRTGRLSKTSDNQAVFTFDADGRALSDPPLIILPNMKLEMLEQDKGGSNRDLRFRVTGSVTEYHNHNYLLLDKVVVIPDVVQQF